MRTLVFCLLFTKSVEFLGVILTPGSVFQKTSTAFGFTEKYPGLVAGLGGCCLLSNAPNKRACLHNINRDVPVEAVGHHLKTTAHRGLFFLMHLLNCIRQPQISSLIY